MRAKFLAFIFLTGTVFASCKTSNILSAKELKFSVDYCAFNSVSRFDTLSMPLIYADSFLTEIKIDKSNLSEKDMLIANATGVLSLWQEASTTGRDTSRNTSLQSMEIQKKISHSIESSLMQVQALIAELSCEVGRLKQIAIYLDNKNKKGNTRLIVASIISGSGTTIAPVWVKGNSAQNAVAISGGLLAAGLGALSLHPQNKKVKLVIDRNLLADFWYVPYKSANYPPSIWHLLTNRKFGNIGGNSIAGNIKRRWLKFDMNNESDVQKEALLFGGGGLYSSDDLITRTQMLAEIISALELLRYSFQSFLVKASS